MEEVTLNPEAAAKKHKVAADKAAANKSRAPSPGKRPAKKAGGKSGKKINSSETAGDDAGATRSLPARVTRLTPQVSLIQRALTCLTCFSQHLIAGMQVLAIVKEVQDLELRVRFDANSLLLCLLTRLHRTVSLMDSPRWCLRPTCRPSSPSSCSGRQRTILHCHR